MDLLAILPYYIEIALQKDTVSLSPSNPPLDIILLDASSHIPSLHSFASRSYARFACFASSVRSAITVLFCCVFLFFLPSPLLLMWDHVSSVLLRSCTYLSDVRETRSWPSDFLYSCSSLSSAPFCTCASSHYVGLTHHNRVRYFIERGTWDDTLEVFINSDGDPSQFAVGPHFFKFSAVHVFLTAHILVHTCRSVVCDPFPVQSPLPDVYFARRFVIVSKWIFCLCTDDGQTT
jgi:hypothetical protein